MCATRPIISRGEETDYKKAHLRVLEKLFRDKSYVAHSDTEWSEVEDWKKFLKTLPVEQPEHPIEVGLVIGDALKDVGVPVVAVDGTNQVTGGEFSLHVYYCTKPEPKFVVAKVALHDEENSTVAFRVVDSPEEAAETYNVWLDELISDLESHARMVSGKPAKEATEIINKLRASKITAEQLKEGTAR